MAAKPVGRKSKDERRPYRTDESKEWWDPRTFEPAHHNLADAIKAAGMTQDTFAGALGVSTATVERWIHGNGERAAGHHLSNGELLQAARILNCNIAYLLDLTTDPQPTTDEGSLPGNIGQYERGRRFIAEYWTIAKDPAKVLRVEEGVWDDEAGIPLLFPGYLSPRITISEMGEKLAASWTLCPDYGMDAAEVTDWDEEVFNNIGGDYWTRYGADARNMFMVDWRGEDHDRLMGEYRERTAERLRAELLAIPGDYRSLIGVCRTMLDRVERTAAPEEADRLAMLMTMLYNRAADSRK